MPALILVALIDQHRVLAESSRQLQALLAGHDVKGDAGRSVRDLLGERGRATESVLDEVEKGGLAATDSANDDRDAVGELPDVWDRRAVKADATNTQDTAH